MAMDWNSILDDAPPAFPGPYPAELVDPDFREADEPVTGRPVKVDPYSLAPLRARLAPYERELERMKSEAEALKVTDEDSAEKAVTLGARCQRIEKAVEDARVFFKAPALEFGKSIDAFAAAFRDKAQAAKRSLSGKVGQYQRKKEEEARALLVKQQEEARKLQEQAKAEAAKLGADAPAVFVPKEAPAPTMIRTTAGKAVMEKRWVCRVTEAARVPREYCEVSQTLLNRAVAAGIREIPGCEIVEETKAKFGA